MDSWERFDETKLPSIDKFYSNLKLENTTDSDYRYANRVFKNFELKDMGEYFNLYVNSDTLLLSGVFENFRNKCIEIYELNPAHFLSALGLAWKACLKKTGIKLELLADVDMLLMVEKGIRVRICHVNGLHNDLPFLPERMKINKCRKLVCNLHAKINYAVHIRSLKQALNHGIILKKVHKVIQFNQEAWLKKYIDMNAELKNKQKMILKKTSLS